MGEVLELVLLYFVLPTVVYFGRFRANALLMLWVVLVYCLWRLWTEGHLALATPHWAGFTSQLPSILALFLSFVLLTTIFVHRFSRHALFDLVRAHPRLWALIMVAYPALSVYPQGIIYRAYFFDRYQSLFSNQIVLVVSSALAFAYLHIVFRNWLALGLTACGGLLFAARYAQTHSLLVSSFEHALYGCWIFTVGLGRSFLYSQPAEKV